MNSKGKDNNAVDYTQKEISCTIIFFQRQSYQKALCGIMFNYFHHYSRIFNFQLKFDFNSAEKIFLNSQ